jgi:hypothetical protein
MSSINADNGVISGITGIRTTADNTGNLALQSNGNTVLTLSTANTATFANNVTISGTLTTSSRGISAASVPAGSVIQVVQANITSFTSTQSTSYVTTNLTATITPQFSTSKILVIVSAQAYINTLNTFGNFTLFRGTVAGTNLGNSTYGFVAFGSTNADLDGSFSMSYLDSPATTSATTYTIGMKVTNAAGTLYIAVNGQPCTITLMEIAT